MSQIAVRSVRRACRSYGVVVPSPLDDDLADDGAGLARVELGARSGAGALSAR